METNETLFYCCSSFAAQKSQPWHAVVFSYGSVDGSLLGSLDQLSSFAELMIAFIFQVFLNSKSALGHFCAPVRSTTKCYRCCRFDGLVSQNEMT